MKIHKSNENQEFIGRSREAEKLLEIGSANESALLIIYGRRRVGKTELIEHTYHQRHLLKFEGIENYQQEYQRQIVMQQLAQYTDQPLLRKVETDNWIDVFHYIYDYTKTGTWTVYFEELQWLADYQPNFISELKYAWDNFFRHNPKLIVVLCGSATSFMIKEVVHSKALYNRSQHEIFLKEFTLPEAKEFFKKKSEKEIMDAYLYVGGIPEYLRRLKKNSSIFLSLCDNAFKKDAFFVKEYKRIFISHFASNKNYEKIIEFLSKRKFATRNELLSSLHVSSGGRISELIDDLILCGFIQKYTPYNLSNNSPLARYAIEDAYLQFYYKFINPIEDDIDQGIFNEHPEQAINSATLAKWLGYAFERFCRKYHHSIAKILGFSAVKYRSGTFYNKFTAQNQPGYQIDLLFDRDDNVLTVCEIKYLNGKVKKSVINEFEEKLSNLANPKNKTLQKILICTFGAEDSLKNLHYFDRIITLQEFFLLL